MKTIVRKKTSFLKQRTKEEFIRELKASINAHALELHVFGSFFTPEFGADSDLDLPFHERLKLFPELQDFLNAQDVPADVIIYAPDEFAKLEEEGEEFQDWFLEKLRFDGQKDLARRPL